MPLAPSESAAREAAYRDFVTRAEEAEARNAGAYDKALLTLSSAALALSLTFGKDIVPFFRATQVWLLFSAWILFVLTIVVNISGFIYALTVARKHKALAGRVYRDQLESADDLNSTLQRDYLCQHVGNVLQGVLFLTGVLFFFMYVMINVQREIAMAQKPVAITGQIKKSFPIPTYIPSSTGYTPAPTQKPDPLPQTPQVLPKK
jgi:hypothetical protein